MEFKKEFFVASRLKRRKPLLGGNPFSLTPPQGGGPADQPTLTLPAPSHLQPFSKKESLLPLLRPLLAALPALHLQPAAGHHPGRCVPDHATFWRPMRFDNLNGLFRLSSLDVCHVCKRDRLVGISPNEPLATRSPSLKACHWERTACSEWRSTIKVFLNI